MKYSCLFLSILFIFLSLTRSIAQQVEGTSYIESAIPYKISFPDNQYFRKDILPFRNIEVIDQRFDSSKIGYVTRFPAKSRYNQVQLKDGWNTILNHYFLGNLDSSSTFSLVIMIRSFWMQEGIYDEITTKKVIAKDAFDNEDFDGFCKAAIDVYVRSDSSLQALIKIEDTFMNFYKFKARRLGEWFFLPFDSMARRIQSLDISASISTRKRLSFKEVDSFYKKRFDIAILQNPAIRKGIFLTFADFQNNKPLETPFKVSKGKLTDELYIVNGNSEDIVTEFWGFHDGQQLYIKTGYSFFPAVRQQNSFEVYGGKHLSNYHNNPQQGDLLRINTMSLDKKILHMNMENGKFY